MKHTLQLIILAICAVCAIKAEPLAPLPDGGSLRAMTGTQSYSDHSVLSAGRWVRIAVTQTGIHQLDAALLSQMGFNQPLY